MNIGMDNGVRIRIEKREPWGGPGVARAVPSLVVEQRKERERERGKRGRKFWSPPPPFLSPPLGAKKKVTLSLHSIKITSNQFIFIIC